MADPASILTMIEGLKSAAELVKGISQASGTLERSELKLRLADVNEALADARMAAVDLKDQLQAKDEEIARLLNVVSIKGEVVKRGDAYFKKSAPEDAFCVYCWDTKKKLIHIHKSYVKDKGDMMTCPECKTSVDFYCIKFPSAPDL